MLTGVVGGGLPPKVHDHVLCLVGVNLESIGLTPVNKVNVSFFLLSSDHVLKHLLSYCCQV